MTLEIRLFNHFQLQSSQKTLTALRPRAQRLLVYLLLHRATSLPRKNLAFTLWPDMSEDESLGTLRRALSDLRAALPDDDDYLLVTRDRVGWNAKAPHTLDVDEYEKQIQRAEAENLQKALDLYTGELLRDMDEEWLSSERERYRQMQFDALRQLTAHHQARQEYSTALELARRALVLDPYSELVYQDRMRIHFLAGNRAAAVAEYERLQSMLENELGVEPMEDTRTLADAIMRGEALSDGVVDTVAIVQIPPRLVGREAETNKLLGLWDEAKQSHGNLAIISGEAGIGKSHLIRAFAHQVAQKGGL
jgi:DNA-binding SARP family transcriptional activator